MYRWDSKILVNYLPQERPPLSLVQFIFILQMRFALQEGDYCILEYRWHKCDRCNRLWHMWQVWHIVTYVTDVTYVTGVNRLWQVWQILSSVLMRFLCKTSHKDSCTWPCLTWHCQPIKSAVYDQWSPLLWML